MAKGVFQKAESFYVDFERKTGPDKLSTHYCPGCGHGNLHKLIAEANKQGISMDQVAEKNVADRILHAAYTIEVRNFAGQPVWLQSDLTSQDFGDGAGAVAHPTSSNSMSSIVHGGGRMPSRSQME